MKTFFAFLLGCCIGFFVLRPTETIIYTPTTAKVGHKQYEKIYKLGFFRAMNIPYQSNLEQYYKESLKEDSANYYFYDQNLK